jgi:exosortase K
MKRITLTLAVVFAVKLYYRSASAADLDWILRPTVWLVELVTRIPFVREAGIGYFNRDVGFAVIPACAGVNFLVAAFATLMLAQRGRLWLQLPVAALAAFAATVVVNAARLAVAVGLHHHRVSFWFLTPPRLHQLEGVIFYVTALFLLALAVQEKKPCAA